jgi:peptidoglycan/xylan/chitin deacetylase (PgdA/CDA1 family)
MNRKIFLLLIFCLAAHTASGEVTFSGLDLSPDNQLLFKATVDLPGYGSYKTLFLSDLGTKRLQQLTFFPEEITYLSDSRQLQIQNRFGVFRTDNSLANIKPVDLFPSFVNGYEIGTGKITPIQSSPDGRYLVYTRPTSAAYGDLILFDQSASEESVISKKVELSLKEPKTIWSPDSKFLVYSTKGNLYYYSLRQYSENQVLSEDFRKIDKGTVHSAAWGKGNNLYYAVRTLVYRIHSSEFFTKTLYTELFNAGHIVGKIPFEFNNNFDRFWISPDGKKILLSKDSRNLFLYYLNAEDFTRGVVKSLPYLYLPRNTHIAKVIWSESGIITLMAESIVKGEKKASLYRLSIDEKGPPSAFEQKKENAFTGIVLSPKESRAVLLKQDRILLYDYDSWKKTGEILFSNPIKVLWTSESSLIIAGSSTTCLHDLEKGTSRIISLSQPGETGFSEDYSSIQNQLNSVYYQRNISDTDWETGSGFTIREASLASSSFRIYLEVSNRGSYLNLIMVRNIRGYGTTTLFPPEKIEYESFPRQYDPVDFNHFSHGSRLRSREVALVFNATETIEGLPVILNILEEYNLTSTFFVNGEAIRRYPDAIKEIAESGHEVGSLFYTYFDMTDVTFSVNKEFIKLGLARTEDDYYSATGSEVSLLWHTPYYFVNSDIIEASQEMNYTYVGRDVSSMDWMTYELSALTPGLYLPASELVERILEKKQPGSIIPIIVGIPEGVRVDYLFQKLDLLINGLVRKGYRIVPVSVLIEHAR